jgi:hypothetical protein
MTCCIDRLRPKLVRGLVFIKHGSCHLYESLVLPFDHPIFLWSLGCEKHLLDAFFIKKVFYLSVLEFSAIVTSNLLDHGVKLVCALFKNLFSTS